MSFVSGNRLFRPTEAEFFLIDLAFTAGRTTGEGASAPSRFADYVEVGTGTTVGELFAKQVSYGKPSDCLIRVNRQ